MIDAAAMNFSWVEEGNVAGCMGPHTDEHLKFLRHQGIKVLIRLEEASKSGMSRQRVFQNGLEDCHEPVKDFTPPGQEQLDRVVGLVRTAVAEGKPVAVSCGAGCGRTGTVLACYLVAQGHSGEDAIKVLLSLRPCSRELVHVPGQKEAILEFDRRLKSSKA